MAKLKNLAKGNLRQIPKKIRDQRYATQLNGSAIGRKGLRVYDGGWIRIENGGLQVTGTAIISGTLNVSGQTNLSGQVSVTGPMNITGTTTIGGNTNITGELNVTGPTTLDGVTDIGGDTTITGALSIDGDTEISGNLDITGDSTISGTLGIEGATTLRNDLNVENNGRITAGQVVIDPSSEGGSIGFAGGGITSGLAVGFAFTGTSMPVRIESLTGSATISGTQVNISATGGATTISGTAGIRLNSNTTVNANFTVANNAVSFTQLPTTQNAPNLYINPTTGRLARSTWTP